MYKVSKNLYFFLSVSLVVPSVLLHFLVIKLYLRAYKGNSEMYRILENVTTLRNQSVEIKIIVLITKQNIS